jgi:hypothetical protein
VPLVGFSCPPSAPTYGDAEPFEHCVSKCKDRCMSPYLLAAMAYANQKNHHKGRYISATALAGCVRKLTLERTVDYAQEVSKVFYGFRGTLTHQIVEEAAAWKGMDGRSMLDMGFLSEWHMKLGFCFMHGAFKVPKELDASDPDTWPTDLKCPSCDGDWFVLGGTLDGGTPVKFEKGTGILWMNLEDLKTMQEYAVDKFVFGDPGATLHTHTKDDYVHQANLYKYLAERSDPPDYLKEKGIRFIRFREAHIQAFAMGRAPYMGTNYWGRKHWKHPYEKHFIPPIEFKDDEWVEQYIRIQGRPIFDSLLTGRLRAPICEPEPNKAGSHSWKCDYCPFYESEYCPAPATEWKALLAGLEPEAAFAKASARHLPIMER